MPSVVSVSRMIRSLSTYSTRLRRVTLYSGGWATNTRPLRISSGMWRKKNVSRRVRMCDPSTSASVMMTIRPYRRFSSLKSSRIPHPMAG